MPYNFVINLMSLDAELNSLQDDIFRFALSVRKEFFRPGEGGNHYETPCTIPISEKPEDKFLIRLL